MFMTSVNCVSQVRSRPRFLTPYGWLLFLSIIAMGLGAGLGFIVS